MNTACEMCIEPGADVLIQQMGRKLGTKARSKVINAALEHLRHNAPIDGVIGWFSEARFAPDRRTTVRLSAENARFANSLAAITGWGRPAILHNLVYLACAQMQAEDFEALR